MRHRSCSPPGPTAVPAEVLETQARPLIHHRTEEFRQAHREAMAGLQYILRTANPVAILTASGSGAMEAAVVNLSQPGDTIITTEVGKFSERWREIGGGVRNECGRREGGVRPGRRPRRRRARVQGEPRCRPCSSPRIRKRPPGVLQDVEAFAKIARVHGALIGVDAITSAGAHDVRTDDWGLDAVVGGSQKGVMIPPGLGYVAVSERARIRMKQGRHPVYYFDLLKALASAEKGDTPYTPAITLVLALRTALAMIREEGIENVIARHDANARAIRAAVTAMGLELLAAVPSNAATAVRTPGDSAGAIAKHLEKRYGVKIAGGQGITQGEDRAHRASRLLRRHRHVHGGFGVRSYPQRPGSRRDLRQGCRGAAEVRTRRAGEAR